MKKRLWCLLLLLMASLGSVAQTKPSLVSFEYTMAPEGNDEVEFYRTNLNVNIPIKVKKGMILNAVGFDYFQLNHNGVNFSTTEFNKIYNISYRLMYMYPITDTWSIQINGGASIVSNLASSLQSEDFLYNAGVSFKRSGGSAEKPYQLVFGLGYVPFLGKPRLLPMINYTKRINDKYTIGLGFPRTYVNYEASDKSMLQLSTWINSFYANLSEDVVIPGTRKAQKSLFRSAGLGISYNYRMDDNWLIFIKGGYSLFNEYELLDDDNNTLYDFEATAKPYFSTGIKFNLQNKKQVR